MAILNSAKRNTSGHFDSGEKIFVRNIDTVLDFTKDVTMTTGTDTVNLIALPGGAQVVSVTIQQLAVGTGTGTLAAQVGATSVSGALASTAPVGTLTTTVPAVLPLVVPLGGAELSLISTLATRLDGRVRVIATIVENDRFPKESGLTQRDATL